MFPRVAVYCLPDGVIRLSQLLGNVDHAHFGEEVASQNDILFSQFRPVVLFARFVVDGVKRSRNVFKIFWAVVKAISIDVMHLKTVGAWPNEGNSNEFMGIAFLADIFTEQPKVMIAIPHAKRLDTSVVRLGVPVLGGNESREASNSTEATDFVESFISGDCAPIFLRGILRHVDPSL